MTDNESITTQAEWVRVDSGGPRCGYPNCYSAAEFKVSIDGTTIKVCLDHLQEEIVSELSAMPGVVEVTLLDGDDD